MESTRQTWNDARMDEFAKRTDEFAQRTEDNFKDVRSEIRGLRGEMNERFAKLEGTFNRRFDILFGALATGFVGAVVSHFIS